jgi:beta-glucosidase
VVAKASAVLECWYPGQEGGVAMAEALLGRINPGAKLPVSVVRNSGQIPLFNERKPTARRGYLFDDIAPLFPFGHGLSYTSFSISDPRLSATRIQPGLSVEVSVDVANTGARAGDEVVQLYVTLPERSVTQPVLALKGFERVTLAPGERKTVTFTLDQRHLSLWNREVREVVEPGPVMVSVGNSSASLKQAEFTIA